MKEDTPSGGTNMTEKDKVQIIELRKQGYGYGKIAEILNLSKSSISTFCKRNYIDEQVAEKQCVCKNCHKLIIQKTRQKAKVFCSDECRVEWWNTHQDKVNKKAIYEFVCPNCGKAFKTYGNKNQKYCSHACYIEARYGNK